MKTNYKVAIVGSTGLVGRTAIKVLEEKNLPIDKYDFFASKNSAGTILTLLGGKYFVQSYKTDPYLSK